MAFRSSTPDSTREKETRARKTRPENAEIERGETRAGVGALIKGDDFSRAGDFTINSARNCSLSSVYILIVRAAPLSLAGS